MRVEPLKRVVTISNYDPELADSGEPLVVAQVTPATVRAVMRLITESLEPGAPPQPAALHPRPQQEA